MEGDKIAVEKDSLTIRINNNTRKRVEHLGSFGQSWDDVLNDMCDFIEEREEEWFEDEE